MKKKGIKILVADDEKSIREVMSYMFEERGFITRSARNGKEALEKAIQEKPDIIILDIMMPEMDGLEAYRQLKENPDTQGIPIIFLSAQRRIEQIIHHESKAHVEYIEKPCDIEYLVKRIKSLTTV